MKMLILRGISGFYAGKNWPRGALFEQPALDYASRRGFEGQVLDISGEAYKGSPQAKLALAEYRRDTTITALYGFSGGGYNLYHVIQGMTKTNATAFTWLSYLVRQRLRPVRIRGLGRWSIELTRQE